MYLTLGLRKALSRPRLIWLLFIIPLMILIVKWSIQFQTSVSQYRVDVFAKPETAPLLFVGGYESSGTTLLRILLDAHPMIRCGSESMTLLPLFKYRNKMPQQDLLWSRAAGVYPEVLDRAIAQYVLTIVRDMGPLADILCYKRPILIQFMDQLAKMFPRAKFIHILRDGRASVASSINRRVSSDKNATRVLQDWSNRILKIMLKCQKLTEERCLTLRYEHLVLDPETQLRAITKFLGIPWDPIVLQHHTILKNLTQLSNYEPSTSRAKQKIDTKSLTKWYTDDRSPGKYLSNVDKEVPLLQALGFIQCGKPPDYTRLPKKAWLDTSALPK